MNPVSNPHNYDVFMKEVVERLSQSEDTEEDWGQTVLDIRILLYS